jgi:hypothetical protein
MRGGVSVSLLGIATDLQGDSQLHNGVQWVPCRVLLSLAVSPTLVSTSASLFSPFSMVSTSLSNSSSHLFTHSPLTRSPRFTLSSPSIASVGHSIHHQVTPLNCTLLGNDTGIKVQWQSLLRQFSSMRARRAFMHWYTTEGADENEFTECESDLNDLISEYEMCEVINDVVPADDPDD